jgi:hypothetical protein
MPLLEASRVVSWPHTIGLIAPWANTFAQGDFRSWPQRRGIQVWSERIPASVAACCRTVIVSGNI